MWRLLLTIGLLQATTAVEPVTIATDDGLQLGARLFFAGHGSPGVVFFPMCSAEGPDGWMPIAERLRGEGVSSLLVTYRGTRGNPAGAGAGDHRGADADAALALLRSRIGDQAPVAFAGASCGVWIALRSAAAQPDVTRGVVALSGPHSPAQLEHVRRTPRLAVFSGASVHEPPSPEWARALREASANAASRVTIAEQNAHGTNLFAVRPTLAADIADWLAARLKERVTTGG